MYSTLAALETAHPTGTDGDAYAVGSENTNVVYIWDVDAVGWVNVGSIQGPQGPQGPQGVQGPQGPQGIQGVAGTDGTSAYTAASSAGYTGTETAFNTALAAVPNKANKKVPAAANNVALLDSSGNLADSGKPLTPAGIGAAATSHTHTEAQVTNLATDLAAKQNKITATGILKGAGGGTVSAADAAALKTLLDTLSSVSPATGDKIPLTDISGGIAGYSTIADILALDALGAQIVAYVDTGSSVSATDGTHTVSGTSVNGSCTLVVPNYGTWTVTATLSTAMATKSVTVDTVKQYAVSLVYLSDTFSANTWEAIISACQGGSVPAAWVVGNQKTMTINGASYTVTIIGKNHDTYTAGGTAPLTFQLQDCYGTKYPMNSGNTNSGGWESCVMRTSTLPAILALMPSAVQTAIKKVNKLASVGDLSATINTSADKLFLLSEIEIFGSTANSKSGEGSQYAYYSAGNSKVKNFSGSADGWWERSPNGSDYNFCVVSGGGSTSCTSPSYSFGVAFGFCF